MDKATIETDAISLNPLKKMSKIQDKMKCRSPILRSNSLSSVHSRYLSEPIGSCHNLCKYGRKHESEHNEKHLTFRRFMANSIALETVHSLVKVPKKKNVIKMEPSDTGKVVKENIQLKKVVIYDNSVNFHELNLLSKHRRAVSSPQFILPEDPKRHIGSLSKEIGLVGNSINVVSEAYSPIHKRIKSFEEIILRNPEQKIQAQVEDDERVQIQSKDIFEFESNINVSSRILLLESKCIEISPQVIQQKLPDNEITDVKFLNSSKNKKHVNKPKVSSMLKSTSVKSNILKQKNSSTSTVADYGNNTIFEEKVLSNLKESATSTTVKAIKQKNIVTTKRSASSKLQSNSQNASFPSRKTNSFATSAIPLNVSFKARKSSKRKEDSGDFKERILKAIEPKIDGKGLDNQEKLSKKLDGLESSEKSSNGQTQRKYKHGANSKEEIKRRARQTPAAQQTSGSSSSPYKLKFKRGKLNELRTADNIAPRRLRFRSGRVIGENPSAEVTKRNFRRKKDIGDSNEHNSEDHTVNLNKANLESEVGMLKYHDEHGKKKIRALFNHVIEETANKLAETRKSKVKALVGAFETVILLQEGKPASVL